MKILRITARGLPLFKEELDILFHARQRVDENDKARLIELLPAPSVYLNAANAFIGINASGKTSILKAIELALDILRNEPINHADARTILGETDGTVFRVYFCGADRKVCCLETEIASKRTKSGDIAYSITGERLWEKPLASIKSRKHLTDFFGLDPVGIRNGDEAFLPDDVSFVIARNKRTKDVPDVRSLVSYTNVDALPFSEDMPPEAVGFLDPAIETLRFGQAGGKTSVHLKFRDEDEIVLNNAADLERYLSSGTIKGIIAFSMAIETLRTGGCLLADDIESHFSKEIATTLMRFFMDSRFNRNGGMLIFTTHYPELLDEYDRNDAIHVVRNRNGITAENLSGVLKRNDMKKSDVYQSGILDGTVPAYEAYMRLKKGLAAAIG